MKQYAAIDDTVYFWFAGNDTSGSGGDGASPAADVRLAGAAANAAPVYSPTPALLSHVNYPAGAYEITITASAANGFAVNNTYAVFCTLAIDSQNPTGFVGSFDTKPVESNVTRLLDTAWLTPAVAGTPDVNAKQLGGTAQTGRDVGASVLLSTGTGAGQLDFTSGIVKSNLTQILAHLLTQTGTQLADGFEHFFDVATPTGTVDSLPAAAPDAAGGLPVSDAGGLDLDTKLANTNEVTAARMGALTDWINGGRLDLILDTIATDTTEIGAAGAGLTDIGGMSVGMKAEVESEANDALVAQKLDHLVAVADADDAVNDSIIAKLAASDGDWSGFSNASDSLEAIRDRGDGAWITGAGGSDRLLMVDTTIATLASQTSFTLTAGSADDDAYNNCTIIIEDVSTATQKAMGIISNYAGATKTITLKYDPAIFAMSTTDKVYILAENALKSTIANRQLNVAADGDIAGNVEGSVASVVGHTAQTGDSYAIVNHVDHGNAKLVRSTTPANKLDVSATGEAGLDFANIKNAAGAHTLTNITVPTVSTLTGHTAQTGDSFARLGAPAGVSIAADLVTIDNFVDDLESRLTAARAGYIDELAAANLPTDIADIPTVAEFNARTIAAASYFDPAADTVTVGTNNDKTGYALTAAGIDSIIDEVIEGALTLRQILRILLSMAAEKSTGGGTATITFRDHADTKARITATVDANGNRTAITLDGA